MHNSYLLFITVKFCYEEEQVETVLHLLLYDEFIVTVCAFKFHFDFYIIFLTLNYFIFGLTDCM